MYLRPKGGDLQQVWAEQEAWGASSEKATHAFLENLAVTGARAAGNAGGCFKQAVEIGCMSRHIGCVSCHVGCTSCRIGCMSCRIGCMCPCRCNGGCHAAAAASRHKLHGSCLSFAGCPLAAVLYQSPRCQGSSPSTSAWGPSNTRTMDHELVSIARKQPKYCPNNL